ncbi:hypothetical protein [Brevibacillus reuszeri]|uniref:hypothetical protein n=1 Tax=Brevibacillus reuszeri TaxID=54915 RepID=UPI003D1ED9DA
MDVNHNLNNFSESVPSGIDTPKSDVYTAFQNGKPISFVFLGRDTRLETGIMNTDVMIVAVANPTTKIAKMVSVVNMATLNYKIHERIPSVCEHQFLWESVGWGLKSPRVH